eukprot:3302571-Rhodomonas_salina.1
MDTLSPRLKLAGRRKASQLLAMKEDEPKYSDEELRSMETPKLMCIAGACRLRGQCWGPTACGVRSSSLASTGPTSVVTTWTRCALLSCVSVTEHWKLVVESVAEGERQR